jgi:hypothetical protein
VAAVAHNEKLAPVDVTVMLTALDVLVANVLEPP